LVEIRVEDDLGEREMIGNLEDISASGACIQLEVATREGASIEMLCANCRLRGKVRYCRASPLGYDIGVAFDERKSWNLKRFEPKHLLCIETGRREAPAPKSAKAVA
jgi:hypothetical protein